MATYHVELRSFPRSQTRFNQSGTQVGAIVLPWVQDAVFEIDGEKWAPYDAQITIIEGPAIPVERLSMGRGWAIAQREGTEVTDRVLAEARKAVADGGTYTEGPSSDDQPSLADGPQQSGAEPELPSELDGLLGADGARLLAAWRAVGARTAGLAPSEALALAERELQGRGGAAR